MTDKTTPPDTILRGIEGVKAAFQKPTEWQARRGSWSYWVDYTGEDGWQMWGILVAVEPGTQWRLRPAKEEREAMRFAENVWLNCVQHTFMTRDGLSFTVTADKGGHWDKKRVRITVEEITDKDESE